MLAVAFAVKDSVTSPEAGVTETLNDTELEEV
jgi:hypothetical protein